MNDLVRLGNGVFFFGWKYGKQDEFKTPKEQLQMSITVGTRILLLSNFSRKDILEFKDEMNEYINEFVKTVPVGEEVENAPFIPRQRSRVHTILDVIKNLEKEWGKDVPIDEIILSAEKQGNNPEETLKILDTLKAEGSIFESIRGIIERVL